MSASARLWLAAMFATGMPNPLLWGAMAGLINYVPFLGHTVSAIVIARSGVAELSGGSVRR